MNVHARKIYGNKTLTKLSMANSTPEVVSEGMKILCVMPCLPEDFNPRSLISVLNQTIPVDMVILLPKKVQGRGIDEKMSKVLNEGLSHIKLEDFDYILRVDSDTVIPKNFLERNLKGEPDLCGKAGHAMLIKIKSFEKALNCTFHPENDDSYTIYKFMQLGFKVDGWKVKPIHKKRLGTPLKYVERGKKMYRLGYSPFHAIYSFRYNFRNIFAIFGYFAALLKREKKFDVADFVWNKQVRKLLKMFIR